MTYSRCNLDFKHDSHATVEKILFPDRGSPVRANCTGNLIYTLKISRDDIEWEPVTINGKPLAICAHQRRLQSNPKTVLESCTRPAIAEYDVLCNRGHLVEAKVCADHTSPVGFNDGFLCRTCADEGVLSLGTWHVAPGVKPTT